MTITARLGGMLDRFLGGRGEHSITVPVLDGALKPNNYIERMPQVAMIGGADNLAVAGDDVLLTSGARLIALREDGVIVTRDAFPVHITFLAASPQGALAIGLSNRGLVIAGGRHNGRKIPADGQPLNCLTAGIFIDEDTLVVCNGSGAHSAMEWSRDLLNLGRSGSVVKVDLASGRATAIASGLGFPSGICMTGDGRLVVAEAWRHRLVTMSLSGQETLTALADMPAYPGRVVRAEQGGFWLTMFAVRSQLQEFVLREGRYKREMMATVAPEFWIAPALSSGRSFKEPLQAGGVIRLGIHKPWAPTRSYGLLVRLDDKLQPIWSAHSRADGTRHGITSCVQHGGTLLVTSKGKGEVIVINHLAPSEPDDLLVLEHAA